jgi:hypothetical protein
MNKVIAGLVIAANLIFCGNGYSALKVVKGPSAIYNNDGISPGDILAVEIPNYNTKKYEIILVRIRQDGSAYFILNGREITFELVKLNSLNWSFYINN